MMIFRWNGTYKIILLLICFSIFSPTPISLAKIGNDSKQQAFSDFEKQIFCLIIYSLEPLSNLKGEMGEEILFNNVLTAKENFTEASITLTKLKVPIVLPDDIKVSLEKAKEELSIGFKALEESMNDFAQYIVNRKPSLFDKYIENRDKGFLYIDGGLTSLATAKLRLNATTTSILNAWKIGKGYFYQLEKTVSIISRRDFK